MQDLRRRLLRCFSLRPPPVLASVLAERPHMGCQSSCKDEDLTTAPTSCFDGVRRDRVPVQILLMPVLVLLPLICFPVKVHSGSRNQADFCVLHVLCFGTRLL